MTLLEQYEIELLIETVIDLKRHHIQRELSVFCDMWNAPEHRAEVFNSEVTAFSIIEKNLLSKKKKLSENFWTAAAVWRASQKLLTHSKLKSSFSFLSCEVILH